MPDRYTIARTRDELEGHFNFKLPENYRARYNAAPAQLLPVVTSEAPEGLSYFFWGTIPGWAANKTLSRKITTVSSDILFSKPMYVKMLRTSRCIIPADGYYFWKRVGKKTRIPYRVELRDKSISAFAGIWEEFEDENDQMHHIFRIITVPSHSEELDDTTPVFLDKEGASTWLKKETEEESIRELLKPATNIDFYTVSSRIENTNIDDSSLIQRVESMNQDGNYSLFD